MTTNNLNTYIENPKALNNHLANQVEKLISQYPYFNTAYLLKSRLLKNNQDAEYQTFLQKAAVYAGNRLKLHAFLHADYGMLDITEITKEKEEGEITQTKETSAITIEKEDTIEKETDEKLLEKKESKIIDYTSKADSKELKSHISETLKRQINQSEEEKAGGDKIYAEQYDVVAPVSRIKREIHLQPENNKRQSGDDLLELDDEKEKKKKQIQSNYQAYELEKSSTESNLPDTDSLIENFIKSNPKIEVNTDDKLEYEDISAQSVEEKEDLFTESLAKIYIMQKNYAKAVFAYEKLILKYPEKKAYFASQIENIRKKINN